MSGIQELIEAAKKAHPAFRYATAVAGIVALVVLFSRFGVSSATLVLGSLIFMGLMTLFVVFARLSRLSDVSLALPARAVLWSVLLLSVASLALLFWSTFFDYPLPIKSHLIGASQPGALSPAAEIPSVDRVRVELLIGNSDYKLPALARLRGPAKDIDTVAASLRSVGFRVKVLPNATRQAILEAWKEVQTVATYGGVALLYYSGHGSRNQGDDLILPVDTEFDGQGIRNSISVSSLMREISAFEGNFDASSGELILYSTAPGGMAIDQGTATDTSPFAAAFVTAVREVRGDIRDVFERISSSTRTMTKGEQVPWISGSFPGRFSFHNRTADRNIGILRLVVFDASRP